MPNYHLQLTVELPEDISPESITGNSHVTLFSTVNGATQSLWTKVVSCGSPELEKLAIFTSEPATELDGFETLENRLNKMAKENFDDVNWRKEVASKITENIFLGVERQSNLSSIVNVQNAAFNERVMISETKGGKVVFVSAQGYVEAHTLKTNVIEVPRATQAFHIVEMEDKLRTNFADIQATLVDIGVNREDVSIYQMVYATICQAVEDKHRYVDIDPLLPSLDSAISEVRDASQDFDCVIIGREPMVNLIKNNRNFLLETNIDLVRKGLVGYYWGVKVIVLRNHATDAGSFFPGNEFVVIGRGAATWVWFGAPITQEWLDPVVAEWHYLVRRSFGFIIPRPNLIRRVICSSLVAEPNDG